jgi:hypothetical protein
MTASDSLIARLEAAEVGSRELDAEIAVLTRWPALGNIPHWVHDEEMEVRSRGNIGFKNLPGNPAEWTSPLVTTSLDAALALAERVLPGWVTTLDGPDKGRWYASVSIPTRTSRTVGGHFYARAPRPALALCAAILKAREASQ